MLNYTKMTMAKLVEEVIFRTTNFRTEFNEDYYTISLMANHAIREIMSKSLPYKDWAYITTLAVSNGTVLPREFIKEKRLMLTTTTKNVEARYSTPMELYNVTDTFYGINFNTAYTFQPVYTLWGKVENAPPFTQSELVIYIRPTTLSGTLDCYVAPAFNYNDNFVIPIPYEFMESVITATLFRVLQKIGMSKESQLVFNLIEAERIKALNTLNEKKRTETMNLDNFVLPVPPGQAPPPPFTQPKRR